MALKTKEILLNELTQVGVIGALLGGFALETISPEALSSVYAAEMYSSFLMYFSVHLNTFSALSSWWLYRLVNQLDSDPSLYCGGGEEAHSTTADVIVWDGRGIVHYGSVLPWCRDGDAD